MKIRSGFVSNSSSSSFVMFGFEIDLTRDQKKDILDKIIAPKEECRSDGPYSEENLDEDFMEWMSGNSLYISYNEENSVLGVEINTYDDSEFEEEKLTLEDINKKLEEIQSVLKVHEPIKIFSGKRYG